MRESKFEFGYKWFAVGAVLGLVLGVRLAQAAPAPDQPLKTAVYKIEGACAPKFGDVFLPASAEARRLMVRNGWEYGGMVTRRSGDGYYCVSKPATSEHPTRMMFMYKVPEGHVLDSMYHSHPGVDITTYMFSGTDVLFSCLLHVPSFIVTENRLVMLFIPTPAICDLDPIRGVGGVIVGMVAP